MDDKTVITLIASGTILLASVLHGGLYTVVSTGAGHNVYVVNKLTGQATVCWPRGGCVPAVGPLDK